MHGWAPKAMGATEPNRAWTLLECKKAIYVCTDEKQKKKHQKTKVFSPSQASDASKFLAILFFGNGVWEGLKRQVDMIAEFTAKKGRILIEKRNKMRTWRSYK